MFLNGVERLRISAVRGRRRLPFGLKISEIFLFWFYPVPRKSKIQKILRCCSSCPSQWLRHLPPHCVYTLLSNVATPPSNHVTVALPDFPGLICWSGFFTGTCVQAGSKSRPRIPIILSRLRSALLEFRFPAVSQVPR